MIYHNISIKHCPGRFSLVGWTWPAAHSLLRTWVVKPPTEVLKKLKPEDRPCHLGVILKGQFYVYKADAVTVESVNRAKGTPFKVGFFRAQSVIEHKTISCVCCWILKIDHIVYLDFSPDRWIETEVSLWDGTSMELPLLGVLPGCWAPGTI